jgi:fucose permease|tara:strand:+ start:1127 stop:1387 length:261 start_codon:yes stop_codon:yes gene_type:complete
MDENFCARCHCNPIDEPLTLLTQCITNLEVARNALIDIDEEKSFDMKLMIATHSLKSIIRSIEGGALVSWDTWREDIESAKANLGI